MYFTCNKRQVSSFSCSKGKVHRFVAWIAYYYEKDGLTAYSYKSFLTNKVNLSLLLKLLLFNLSAIGIFGAFFLLLLIVADVIPQALTTLPIFGRYLLANMVLVVLAMFFSTIATSLYGYPDNKPMSNTLERVSIK